MLKIGNYTIRAVYKGTTKISLIYKGTTVIFPGIETTNSGTDYDASWTYPSVTKRVKNAYPWTQAVYQDGSRGSKVYGSTYQVSETGIPSTENSGLYWNGSCGSNYYYVDYKKVRTKYTFSDGYVTYGDYYNGDSRSQRIDGSCGWVRNWTTWANTGSTCNANGTAGQYSCDGTWTVKYYQQVRYYQYPDGSGRTSTEYRAGSEYSRVQTEGQCGYTAAPTLREWQYYGYSDYSEQDAYWNSWDYPQGSLWQNESTGEYFTDATGMYLAAPGYYLIQKGFDVDYSMYIIIW